MRKIVIEKVVIDNYEKSVVTCDICGKEFSDKESWNGIVKCEVCGKDICHKCCVDSNTTREWKYELGDYNDDDPEHWCQRCWDIGGKYRERYIENEHNYHNNIEKIFTSWKTDCSKSDKK